MSEGIQPGDRVQVRLDAKIARGENWFEGSVVRIDPYSNHRSFYWVELDADAQSLLGIKQISIFNPKNIRKVGQNP